MAMADLSPPSPSSSSGFSHLRSLGPGPAPSNLIRLRSNRLYTVGRDTHRCHILLHARSISRRHSQFFLHTADRKLRLRDGFLQRPSLNGVYVNGRRLPRGSLVELSVGDEILLGCRCRPSGSRPDCTTPCGFLVEKIFFLEAVAVPRFRACNVLDGKPKKDSSSSLSCAAGHHELLARAALLLQHCTSISRAADPVSYLGSENVSRGTAQDLIPRVPCSDAEQGSKLHDQEANDALGVISREQDFDVNVDQDSSVNSMNRIEQTNDFLQPSKGAGTGCHSEGSTFFLNRLEFTAHNEGNQQNGVSLPELMHPAGTLIRVFVATFTSDVPWFLKCCQLPNHLPITIACHCAERCWSSSLENRTSMPYSNYPNLLLVYPPFPDIIAFGKDRKRKGVACHHPKLIVLQREDSIRVIVTSANLNAKQWKYVTNTVWWQDFPRRKIPDYSALFGTSEDSTTDFAAQLAGFIASLITDVPNQAHWIAELTNYDFVGAAGHLVASVPGVHIRNPDYSGSDHCLSAKQIVRAQYSAGKFIGSVQASVVGLSHRFHTKSDTDGAQLKMLATFLGKCRVNTSGMSEVLLKRSINIPADANAVGVLIADLDEFSEGDCIQVGFLPKHVAKWVSPLTDIEFFSFSAFIYPKEVIAAALGGSNTKVKLMLYVSQGPKFCEMSKLIQPVHVVALCSLLASIQRCLGLWRLQEVLSQYKWPESLETDFIYGSSSIGSSVNPQFLASFSAAVGKKSFQFSESEESDPEWGCWSKNHELRNPSMKILFPTIKRVKHGPCGILPSRHLLSLSEKTWKRLKPTDIFHDAVPHPAYREGYPMHVKVARRRFESHASLHSFGWAYCGSHNFSPAAWGQSINNHPSELPGTVTPTDFGTQLHICNYEIGVLIIVPPPYHLSVARGQRSNLDDILLPFVIPAPKYEDSDRPATTQALQEALAEAAILQRDVSLTVAGQVDVEVPEEEEEMPDTSDYIVEEREEEKVYAEMLWSQVDSSDS